MTYGKTTLHGITQSVPSDTNLPDRGNQAAEIMLEDLLDKRIYDIENDLWLPSEYICARYDFDVDGGGMGTHTLNYVVPANTIILDGVLLTLDPMVGAGGIDIAIEGASDLLTTTVPTIASEGLYDLVPVGTAATMIKTSVDRSPIITFVGLPVTAGAFLLFMRTVRGFSA